MHLRLIDHSNCKAQLQWEPRDMWVGLFWRTNHEMNIPWYTLHIYICVLPLIPLHITLLLRSRVTKCDQGHIGHGERRGPVA